LLFLAPLPAASEGDGWPAPPTYTDHQDLSFVLDRHGRRRLIHTTADWHERREHILAHFQRAAGPLPSPTRRVPLDVRVIEEVRIGSLLRRKLTYQSDLDDRVPAYLFLPSTPRSRERLPALLCLQQTTAAGKDEPAGVRGDPSLKYALELAERGYVTIAPDYPSFGEHAYDFDPKHGYSSGTMKAVWDNIRAIDLLETLPEVDAGRIGCIGHSLGGHNGLFTAVFDERIKAVVTSCGFTSLQRDDIPSWTGPRYMPRLASEFGNDPKRVPFDFHELVSCLSPRAVFVSAATRDDDFDATGVREVLAAAATIYRLHRAEARLQAHFPDAPHSFPESARRQAYEFLDRQLAR
jgi:dienelactone hydrolase